MILAGVAKTEENPVCYEILAVTRSTYRQCGRPLSVPPGLETKLDGIFLISLIQGDAASPLSRGWHQTTVAVSKACVVDLRPRTNCVLVSQRLCWRILDARRRASKAASMVTKNSDGTTMT